MAIYPSPSSGGNVPPSDEESAFDKTLNTAGNSETLVLVIASKKGRSFTVRNRGPGAAFIEADDNANSNSTRLEVGDTYVQDNVEISTKLCFVGEPGKKPRCTGVLWCGPSS